MRAQTDPVVRLHGTLQQLSPGKRYAVIHLMTYFGSAAAGVLTEMFLLLFIFFPPVSIRFPGRKYGKWKGLVCAVRRAVNGKRRYRFFAPKPNKARKSLERYDRTVHLRFNRPA